MINIEITLYLVGVFLILLGILIIIKKKQIDIPEGFENATPEIGLDDLSNPLIKTMKKIGKLTKYFANPNVWIDVYKHSQMSLTDLARSQIEKDKI
jgi:hypothetical protein